MAHACGHRYAVPILAVVTATTLGGCATQAVWKRWSTRREVSSIGLAVQTSRPGAVEIRWRGITGDDREPCGLLSIDPELAHCAAPRVLAARRAGAPSLIGVEEQVYETDTLTTSQPLESIWSSVDDPACTVVFIFRRIAEPNMISVIASWQFRSSESRDTAPVEIIGAPRDAVWLFVLPAAAIADTTLIVSVVPVVVCLAAGDHCLGPLMGSLNGYESSSQRVGSKSW